MGMKEGDVGVKKLDMVNTMDDIKYYQDLDNHPGLPEASSLKGDGERQINLYLYRHTIFKLSQEGRREEEEEAEMSRDWFGGLEGISPN